MYQQAVLIAPLARLLILLPALRVTRTQTAFAMLPVLQPTFLLVTVELADGDFLGHACNRKPEPFNQFPEHVPPPTQQPANIRGNSRLILDSYRLPSEY